MALRSVVLQGFRRVLNLKRKLPVIAGHKLLYSCNLRCRMCPFWRRKDEKLMDLEEERKMMKKLADLGIIFMGFEGGEPLLRRDLPEILKESHDRFHTTLVTNGVLLKNRVEEIKNYLDYIFVSLDGIGEVHDKIRGSPGAFSKTVESIKVASKYLDLGISVTLMRENLDQAEALVELAEELGVAINFQIEYDYSTAEKLSPSREKLRAIIERLLEMKVNGAPIINSREYFEALLNSWYYGKSWECKPWLTINIDPTGKIVLPCYVLNEYKGTLNVLEVNIREVWSSFNWEKYLKCNKCALSCYLEPSLFSWTKLSSVRNWILNTIPSIISSII